MWTCSPARQSTAPIVNSADRGRRVAEHAHDLRDRRGQLATGRRERGTDGDRPRQRIGQRAAQRQRRCLRERAVLDAGAMRVRLREREADRAGDDEVDDDRTDHRPGRRLAEQRDEERDAHEAGVREGSDEGAEPGIAQVDAASSRSLAA